MSVAGVIPARWASTRFPGKILTPLCGKPLIEWVWQRAQAATRLDHLLVATDDSRIYQAVESFGGRAVMTQPDHPSGTDRIAEAVRDLNVDAVLNIQGDEPLIEPTLIDDLARDIEAAEDWDMATAAAPIQDVAQIAQSGIVKVVCDQRGQALYFSRAPIPFARDLEADPFDETLYLRHIGIYAYRREFLEKLVRTPPSRLELTEKLEQLRALHIGARIKVIVTTHTALGVDEPGDVALAEAALRQAGLA